MGVVRRLPLATLLVVTAWTVGGLAVDRQVGHGGQLALGVFTVGVLATLLAFQPTAVRIQTLAVVVIATLGEIIGSLVWGLYGYRLENLPSFVPPGHGLVYLAGLSLAALLARHATALLLVAGLVAAIWGVAGVTVLPASDVSGTIGCAFLIGVLVWARRPVYAGVFMVVVGLELYGTALGTWTWQPTVPGLGLSQGNPPSGVASGYVVFDVLALTLIARLSDRCGGASVEERPEIRGADHRARTNQLARGVDLVPDVPEQEPARLAVAVDVGDDTLAVRLRPLGDRVETRVDVADRLVAELEQIGVEERQMVVRLRCARHVGADGTAVGVRVVLVLDAPRASERRDGEASDVAGGEDVVASSSAAELVDEDAVVHLEPGRLREVRRGDDPEPGDDHIGLDCGPALRRHHTGRDPLDELLGENGDALLAVVVADERGQVRREEACADPVRPGRRW